MEIYVILALIVFLKPLDCISAPGPMEIYWNYCYFCMPAQRLHFHKNDENYAKRYNIMQNVVSSRITQNSHKLLIFSRIYTARNLDIPKEISINPHVPGPGMVRFTPK